MPAELVSASRQAWDTTLERARVSGVRNSQAVVLAPTGTIGLVIDGDTTGVEPDLGLVKTKKLVGGGSMSIVNQTCRVRCVGSVTGPQIDEIIAHIDEHKSVLGAPHLRPEHLPVFACSMGDNIIHYLGHVRMMAAVQPFISGAISRRATCPNEATVEEVESAPSRRGSSVSSAWPSTATTARSASRCRPPAKVDGRRRHRHAGAPIVERVIERIVPQPVRAEAAPSRTGRDLRVPCRRLQGFRHRRRVRRRPPGEIFVRCRSRVPRSRASWTRSPSRSATVCSTGCRCGRSSRRSSACASNPPA